MLNARAFHALSGCLSPFGQLLELDCQGEAEYFYNVTNLSEYIDRQQSTFGEFGTIEKEVFLPGCDGDQPLIFKDPLTAHLRIYINQAARAQIETILKQEQLTGLKFSEPGSWAC